MTAFMAVVFVLIFASGAWFAPMWRREERDRFGVSMLGSFLLLFLAIRPEALSAMHAAVAAAVATALLGIGAVLMARHSGGGTGPG